MRLNRAKSYPGRFAKTTIKAVLKNNTFGHKLTLTKSLPALDVALEDRENIKKKNKQAVLVCDPKQTWILF